MLGLISGQFSSAESIKDTSRVLIGLVVLSMGAFLSLRGRPDIPVLHFATRSTISLSVRKSKGSLESTQIALRDFVTSRCPSLSIPFVPAWYLFNGHLQTLYSVLGDFSKIDKVVYHRKLICLMDGGTLGLDFTPDNADSFKEDAPLIVLLHGLTGGSYESYVRSVLAPACAPVDQGGLGYRAVVVNFRGCAGTPITSPRLYSGAHTDDIRQAVFYLASRYPKAPLLGVGFSLGANVLARYLAEEGPNSRLASGCILGCPWSLEDNNIALKTTFIGRHVYSKGMGSNLQRLLTRSMGPLTKDPSTLMAQRVSATLALKRPTLDEFDHSFTRYVGGTTPPFPFASADDYYRYGGSDRGLGDICVPFLTVNAVDDPIVRTVPLAAGGHGWGVMAMTAGGGHLGWFESGKAGELKRWIRKPVLEWLRAVGEDLIHDSSRGLELHEVDGFIKEVGRDDLGCKEVDSEAGYVIGTAGQQGMLAGL